MKAVNVSDYNSFLLQVDLEKTKRLTGIITQGAKDFGVVQFVSVFKIAYSNDGESWSIVKDENTSKDKVIPKCALLIWYTVCLNNVILLFKFLALKIWGSRFLFSL